MGEDVARVVAAVSSLVRQSESVLAALTLTHVDLEALLFALDKAE